MTHDMITRDNSTSDEMNMQVRRYEHGPNKGAKKAVLITVLSAVAVLAVILGFVFGSVFGVSDDEQADDGSNVVVPEEDEDGGVPGVPNNSGAVSVDDHEAVASASKSSTIEGVPLSGDPTDLYFVISAPEGSTYSVTTFSTDESGERIENDMKRISDTTKVLTPEETGLHVEEGVLLIDKQGASGNCDKQFTTMNSGIGSDPGCAYGVSYYQPEQNADGPAVIVAFDGTGKVIVKNEFYKISTPMFFKNEGGEIVERTEA